MSCYGKQMIFYYTLIYKNLELKECVLSFSLYLYTASDLFHNPEEYGLYLTHVSLLSAFIHNKANLIFPRNIYLKGK